MLAKQDKLLASNNFSTYLRIFYFLILLKIMAIGRKKIEPFSGSQKWKYFIELWSTHLLSEDLSKLKTKHSKVEHNVYRKLGLQS